MRRIRVLLSLIFLPLLCYAQLKEVHEIDLGRINTNTHGIINARAEPDQGEVWVIATDSNDGTLGVARLSQDDVRKTIAALDQMLARPDKQWDFTAGASDQTARTFVCSTGCVIVNSSIQTTLVGVVEPNGRTHDAINVTTNKKFPLEFLASFKTMLERGLIALPPSYPSMAQGALPEEGKDVSGKRRIQTPYGHFAVWVDGAKWRQTASETVGALEFANVSGQSWVKVISEAHGIPTDKLPDRALASYKHSYPDARITARAKRTYGKQVIALQFSFSYNNTPVRLYGYYYGDKSGTLQVIGSTGESTFDHEVNDILGFLNGLEVLDQKIR